MDPSRFRGTRYDAPNWVRVGRTKGFARRIAARDLLPDTAQAHVIADTASVQSPCLRTGPQF